MRYLGLLLVAVLAVGALVLPGPEDPTPGQAAAAAEQPVAVCPVQEGSGRSTDAAVLSTVDGPTRLTLFTGGMAAGTLETRTGPSGSTVIPVGDVAAVGTVGGLIELPNADSAAGVTVTGAASHTAEACASTPSVQTFMTGGSTVTGENFVMQLMNPYAGEALASLDVVSEAGIESNDRFESVIVPPRSSRLLDFSELVPGRESLSVSVETLVGRVISVGRQEVEAESSIWPSVPMAQDWFLPVPKGGPTKTLLVATGSAVEVDYQIDFYGPEGLEEALITGVLPARGRHEIDLAEISEEAAGVRVVSTGPVVASLRVESETALATTNGAISQANRWMLPGAGTPDGGSATVVIMNAGLDDATVGVRPLRPNTSQRELTVDADDVIELGLEQADGYLIESTGPVVVLWTSRTDSGSTLAIGVPISDG